MGGLIAVLVVEVIASLNSAGRCVLAREVGGDFALVLGARAGVADIDACGQVATC